MITVEQFLKDQIAVWKNREQKERNQAHAFGPYLLISRESGAGGREVAKRVGERLGWHVFDREIVDEIARQTNLRRQLIESLDEQDRGAVENYLITTLGLNNIDETRFEHQLRQVILTFGRRGQAVIIGRGGHFILPGQFGLSVRLIAPLKTRVERIAAEKKLSFEKAKDAVEKLDHDRAKFIRHYFKNDVNDPLLYDLFINTSSIGMTAATEIILTSLNQKLSVTGVKRVGTGRANL